MTAKLSFRKWLTLEQHKKQLSDKTEVGEFPNAVFAYLTVAHGHVDEKEFWKNSVLSFMTALKEFQPDRNLPLLKDSPTKQEKPSSWDYEGRTWAYWSHLLAKAYGWTLEYIGKLDVNEALARVQEILTDDQLDREFTYSLSEIAYPYNSSTKKSVFKPMPRPYWMKEAAKPLRKFKFRRDMLPVGNVQDISGMPSEYNPLRDEIVQPNQEKTEKTNPPSNP